MTSLVNPIVGQPDGTQPLDPFEPVDEMPHLWHVHQMLNDIANHAVHLDHDTDQATIHGLPATAQQDKAITDLIESGYAERLPHSGDMALTMLGITIAHQWRRLAIYTTKTGERCA